jgi:membrane-bound ClpP family serine protease
MIGKRAKVVSALHPTGQVQLDGELWEATAPSRAEVGDTVVVRKLDGLTLVVEPEAGSSSRSDDVESHGSRFASGEKERREANGH